MVDYSKWNNIDVSEDEDDYHPNVDQVGQSVFVIGRHSYCARETTLNHRALSNSSLSFEIMHLLFSTCTCYCHYMMAELLAVIGTHPSDYHT